MWAALAGVIHLVRTAIGPGLYPDWYAFLTAVAYGLMLPVIAVLHVRHAAVRDSGAVLGTIIGTVVVAIGIGATSSPELALAALFVRAMWWCTVGKLWWETGVVSRWLGAVTLGLAIGNSPVSSRSVGPTDDLALRCARARPVDARARARCGALARRRVSCRPRKGSVFADVLAARDFSRRISRRRRSSARCREHLSRLDFCLKCENLLRRPRSVRGGLNLIGATDREIGVSARRPGTTASRSRTPARSSAWPVTCRPQGRQPLSSRRCARTARRSFSPAGITTTRRGMRAAVGGAGGRVTCTR